jgi:hypothetical protein
MWLGLEEEIVHALHRKAENTNQGTAFQRVSQAAGRRGSVLAETGLVCNLAGAQDPECLANSLSCWLPDLLTCFSATINRI